MRFFFLFCLLRYNSDISLFAYFVELGVEPRDLVYVGKHSTPGLHPSLPPPPKVISVARAGLKLPEQLRMAFNLYSPPTFQVCWGYRYVPPCRQGLGSSLVSCTSPSSSVCSCVVSSVCRVTRPPPLSKSRTLSSSHQAHTHED